MKPLLLLLITTLSFSTISAQKGKAKFFTWDKDWKAPQNAEDAAYMARMTKLNDTTWEWKLYHFYGPMIEHLFYKDEKATVLHGNQTYYHPSGWIDSSGMKLNNLQHGIWAFSDDSGRTVLQKTYEYGNLLSSEDMTAADASSQDTLENAVESMFPGGVQAWHKYLSKNLTYPKRAQDREIMGEVRVGFIVDTLGKTGDFFVLKSVEYSLDEELARLLSKSPKWKPASRDGKPVKSYKMQPLVFRF